MSGNFPPDYFAPGYFAPGYFGGDSEAAAGAMSATLAGSSSVTANLTIAEAPAARTGGGGRRKRPEDEKYRPPLPLVERAGLPGAYREKQPPKVAAARDSRIAATVAQIKADAGLTGQQRRNNQAAAAIIMTVAALSAERTETQEGAPPDAAPSAKQKQAQVEAAMMAALAAAMENELV